MNVKQSSADNVWKLICHLIFPKILKYSRKNRYTVYYSITIFYKNYNFWFSIAVYFLHSALNHLTL